MNLISNAKDALLEYRERDRLIHIAIQSKNEERVEICIQDNGGGIDEKIIKRVFEPYFTTKHKSQGTGLGLHMVHRLIVEGMAGNIYVKNRTFVDKGVSYTGAEFTVDIPIKGEETSSGGTHESV
jgi:signal transduction histidine kinase